MGTETSIHTDTLEIFSAYLWQLFELVGIEEKLLQAATVAEYFIRDCLQVAMPLVHRLDVAVAAPQGDTLQHVRPPRGIWLPVLLKSPHRRMKLGGREVAGREDNFAGVGSLNVKTLAVFPRRSRAGGRNPLRDTKIIPPIC